MGHKLTTVFLICLLLPLTAFAHGNQKYVNGLWYDGKGFTKKTMYSVEGVLRDSFAGEAATIDLAGRWIVPPLADAHNHVLDGNGNLEEQLARYLRAGIFYVKNPNSLASRTTAARARMNTPETIDAVYSNGGLTSSGGHPIQIYDRFGPAMNDDAYYVVDSAPDLERKWGLVRAGKPDFIKVYLDHSEQHQARMGKAEFYGKRGLDPALLPMIVKRAHADGLTVTAHVTTSADFHNALTAGVDEITHLPLAPITQEDATLAARHGVTVVSTVLSHRPTDGIADVMALHRSNLELLTRAGVRIILGIDNGDRTILDEIEAIAQMKLFTSAQLLAMAVTTTPRSMFPGRKIGSLEHGSEASFLALDGNPLEDLRALRRIATRVKQGHLLQIAPEKPSVAEALMPVLMAKGTAAALQEYARLEREEKERWDFGEQRLNQLGYALLNHGKAADAVTIFRLNAEKFPASSNVWDSLGEGQLGAGLRDEAIASYRKALEINPKNENAQKMLNQILAK